MRCSTLVIRTVLSGLFFLLFFAASAQLVDTKGTRLKIRDFVLWGGASSPKTYNGGKEGVFVGAGSTVDGKIGSTQLISTADSVNMQSVLLASGNRISFGRSNVLFGDLVANNEAKDTTANVISLDAFYSIQRNGSVTANGHVLANEAGFIAGPIALPNASPSYYSGPTPRLPFNILEPENLPAMPQMPVTINFSTDPALPDITSSTVLKPGVYGNLKLNGDDTILFSETGTYIFNSISNTGINVFDFNPGNDISNTINIYVVGNADLGQINSFSGGDFNAADHVYTEVHGIGTRGTAAFQIDVGPLQRGVEVSYGSNWFGTVWAPNGNINIRSSYITDVTAPTRIQGALWTPKQLIIGAHAFVSYVQLSIEPNFIEPYYPPPPTGKVDPSSNIIGAELTSPPMS